MKPFLTSRALEIHTSSLSKKWSHVRKRENPEDIISCRMFIEDLEKSSSQFFIITWSLCFWSKIYNSLQIIFMHADDVNYIWNVIIFKRITKNACHLPLLNLDLLFLEIECFKNLSFVLYLSTKISKSKLNFWNEVRSYFSSWHIRRLNVFTFQLNDKHYWK